MVNLSQRAEIVKRMDSQFNSNLEMRRTLHALDQRAKAIYANCKLFQKEFQNHNNNVFDLIQSARSNRSTIEAILERPDMKKIQG